ncbi:MAG: radical SAM protein [bacterium]|nr:radical SAM protein [bacterium]
MESRNSNQIKIRANTENLAVMLTSRCQMICPYCAIDRNEPDMPELVLIQAIDLLFTSLSDKVELQFFGGEPLLRWDLIKKGMAYAGKKSIEEKKKTRYLLTTNGLLLDEQKIRFLKRYPVTIMYSMDGDKKTQIKNRPLAGTGPYPAALLEKNLQDLIRVKADYFVNLTFYPRDLKEMKSNIDHLRELGVKNIQLSYAVGTYWSTDQIRSYLRILSDLAKVPDLNIRNLLSKSEPVLASPQILITSAGKIYLGCAAVLERSFPLLNRAFYFSGLTQVKNLSMLEREQEEQLKILDRCVQKLPSSQKKVISSNLLLGRAVEGFLKRQGNIRKENFVDSLMIMTTCRCQLACDYCQVRQSNRTMPKEILFRSIDLLLTTQSPRVLLRFWGGEPLLQWGLMQEGIRYAEKKAGSKGKKASFMITTNGLLLDKKKISYLKKHDAVIMFSLDGDKRTNQAHRLFRGKQDIYDRLLKNVRLLSRSGLPYFINMVVTPLNVGQLFRNLLFFKETGLRKIQICHQVTDPWPGEKMEKYLEELEKVRNDPALAAMIMNFSNQSEPQFLSNEIIADTDGKVYYDAALFLEKAYPEFRKACHTGHVDSLKDIDALYRDKNEIYSLFRENALPRGRKIFLNNIRLGRKLAHFYDNFFSQNASLQDDEKPFFVNFYKNEFLLQKGLVRQLKINALFFHLRGPCLNNCIFCR